MNQNIVDPSLQVCAFRLGTDLFAIDLKFVQEVFRYQECTPVPLSSRSVKGLLNLRGQIVMAIDLRERLGIATRVEGKTPISILVRSQNGAMCFLVDELFDIITLEAEQYEPIPETLGAEERRHASACFKLDNELMTLLDVHSLGDLEGSVLNSQVGKLNRLPLQPHEAGAT